ncbi:hypothetical protein FRB97_001737 [Tulasnella sp. 331]|nr:hypothetical protein FRB97_001737 [Tulasnella sp. 331]
MTTSGTTRPASRESPPLPRIHPKLIPMLETTRQNRHKFEKAPRADRRWFTITQFYNDSVGAAMMVDPTLRRNMLPENGEVRLISVVKQLAEEDTECETREMEDEVIDEIAAGAEGDSGARGEVGGELDKGRQKAPYNGGYASDEQVTGGMPWFVGRPTEREGSPSSIWTGKTLG